MTEKALLISFCVVVVFLFSLNFNQKWNNKTFEKVKSKNGSWYWFRVFKIEQTKENYIKMVRGLSIFVISVMTVTLIMLVTTL